MTACERRPAAGPVPARVLVVGFARTGESVARVLAGRGSTVVAVDDAPSPEAVERAERAGVDLLVAPGRDAIAGAVRDAELVVASPGVPLSHEVFDVAGGVPVVSEVELAFRLGGPQLVAVTGTNGKTTVTSLVTSMLARSGLRVRAAGNIGYPLVEAVVDAEVDLVVAEVSSFQLALTTSFRPKVGAWLNLAEDHLDWHGDLEEYASAKARIWACQQEGDVAVANAADPGVLARARASSGTLVTFGADDSDVRLVGSALVGPGGSVWADVADLPRAMPHDVSNALAAIAIASSAGGARDACRDALREAAPLAHRVSLVGSVGGVAYLDDSKATTPAAVVAALAGLGRVVLIAGGRNKGLDLRPIADAALGRGGGQAGAQLRAVVAIGEAAGAVSEALAGPWPVEIASSMHEAVVQASALARPGDSVLLSPGCASFDWYRSYEERGDDFVDEVRALSRADDGER
ncbi:MAG: UDP-N-acetylmuramoyl-L-alanine--D-glutamate ligase [Actinomycetota bacterium]|nr:UDP-N-acetylmuramoyl-L-alanine--D-glutamate ligase [Actinomycetota bacterium]